MGGTAKARKTRADDECLAWNIHDSMSEAQASSVRRLVTYGADSVITALALGRDRTSIVIGDDVGRLQMLQLHRFRLA
jgi:hypothetical protein